MYPGDLEYNRRGVLGPGQRARLQALSASYGSLGMAFGAEVDVARALHTYVRRDLEEGRVIATTGEVRIDLRAFHAGMEAGLKYDLPGNYESIYYVALDAGGTVKLARWLDLLPGRFELYVGVHSGFVIGASPLPPLDHAQTLFTAVCAVQGLATETLAENRRGRMTEAQQSTLRSTDGGTYGCCLFILFAILGFYPAGRFLGFLAKRRESTLTTLGTAALALFVFACGIAMVVHDRRRRAITLLDAEEGRVATFDAPLQKSFSVSGHSVYRKLVIGPHTFDITERAELYATLIPGFVYRAYFAPRSAHLLALELLPQNRTIAIARF